MNQLTNIFKLLSDDTRLRMLLLLHQQDLCVCEISGILEVPQSRVSKNLSKMRDLNLVIDDRREKFVFYSLKKEHDMLIHILEQIQQNISAYPQIKRDLERSIDKDKYINQCQVISEIF